MHSYQWSPISKKEGTLIRALAILAIVFHNYLHLVESLPGENEFNYRAEKAQALIHGLRDTPWDCFRILASYFGHYGVQIFFFLSGYGLSIQYRLKPSSWWAFQKRRWAGIYPAILVAALGYLIYDSLRLDPSTVIQTEGLNLIRQIIGVSNFIPDNIYHPIGPWWFIGVILQFYLLVPLILKWTSRHGNRTLYIIIGLSMLSEYLLGPVLAKQFDFNINHSILGHLDVCALGILFARKERFELHPAILTAAGILFILGNTHATLWISTGVSITLILIPLLRTTAANIATIPWLDVSMTQIGQLSLYIFLCNGYLRRPLIGWAQQQQDWWTSLWTSLLFLGLVLCWSLLLRFLVNQCQQRLGIKR
ncbi:acyltransferase [Verrucomicrobiaceae bacterium N1E253]|uniref:Acyltransferase n=1 Tax=Oceaniferula marina TaxID=2748318 RepID=A0A851GAP5_9BACT|nr:acyltransferase [Oceaniferula marina]NWK54838.1 acyltransferase [Oceaniferula marina]